MPAYSVKRLGGRFILALAIGLLFSNCLPTKSKTSDPSSAVTSPGGPIDEKRDGAQPTEAPQTQGGESFGGDPAIERLATANSILARSNELLFHPDLKREQLCSVCTSNINTEHCVLLRRLQENKKLKDAVVDLIMKKLRNDYKPYLFKDATKEKLSPFVRLREENVMVNGRPVLARVRAGDEASAGSPVIEFNSFFVTVSEMRYLATVMGHELGHFFGVKDDDVFASDEGAAFGDQVLTLAGACLAELDVSFYSTPPTGVVAVTKTLTKATDVCNLPTVSAVAPSALQELDAQIATKQSHCPAGYLFDTSATTVDCNNPVPARGIPMTLILSRQFNCLPETVIGGTGTIVVVAEASYPNGPACPAIDADLEARVKERLNQRLNYFKGRCKKFRLLFNGRAITADKLYYGGCLLPSLLMEIRGKKVVTDYECELDQAASSQATDTN